MENQNLKAVTENVENATVEEKEFELNENEKRMIQVQRNEMKRLQEFKEGYESLVKETGFTWALDVTSTFEAPKLGIRKVN